MDRPDRGPATAFRTVFERLAGVAVLALLVGCDHATKLVAKTHLESDGPTSLIRGVFELRYAENTDIGFNLLRWVPERVRWPLLTVLGGLTVLALLIVVLRRPVRTVLDGALLLVTAGAVGNYLDRLLRGYVVDFLHLRYWPIFNVADIYLAVGGVLLALTILRRQPPPATARPA